MPKVLSPFFHLKYSLTKLIILDLEIITKQLDESHEFKVKLLEQLTTLKQVLTTEQSEFIKCKSERKELKTERDALKKENEKLQYRIIHLLRSLEAAESKQ